MKRLSRGPTGLIQPTGPDQAGLFTLHGSGIKFKSAPNRYRRLYKDGQTSSEYWAARSESVRMQREEFTIRGFEPVGMELSPFNWDEILVWVKKPRK